MKKLLLLGAAFAAASLFTACESSDTSDVTSCEIKVLGVRYACMESADAIMFFRPPADHVSVTSAITEEGVMGQMAENKVRCYYSLIVEIYL